MMQDLTSADLPEKPLVVDLDGTLIYSDLLHESVIKLLKKNPFKIFFIPFILIKGKAFLKQYLASKIEIYPQLLPYNKELLDWLFVQHAQGRKLILCTASDKKLAKTVSNHLGIFDEVIASDGVVNIAGKNKASILVQLFGHHGYDYVGNSYKDLPVWKWADKAIVA